MFLVTLDFRVVHLAANQAFSVEHSVFRIRMEGVLSGITNTTRMNVRSETLLDGKLAIERHTVVPRRRMLPMKE